MPEDKPTSKQLIVAAPRLKMNREVYENKLDEKITYGENLLKKALGLIKHDETIPMQITAWDNAIRNLLDQAFFVYEHRNPVLQDYLTFSSKVESDSSIAKRVKNTNELNKVKNILELKQSMKWLKAHKEILPLIEQETITVKFTDDSNNTQMDTQINKSFTNKCFIVHGHNNEVKLNVARFLENRLGKKAIILHEQANGGKVIIEKFEKHSEVDFAVALWTADDTGKAKNEESYKPRARQNVIFETAYFAGKLGRDRVIILRENGVEIPSDLLGVVYIDLAGGWEEKLRREIEAIYENGN